MALVKITTPVDEAMIRSLNVGDTVMISGRLYTGRDAVHHRIHEGTKPPVDLRGAILYHCGPVMVKEGDQPPRGRGLHGHRHDGLARPLAAQRGLRCVEGAAGSAEGVTASSVIRHPRCGSPQRHRGHRENHRETFSVFSVSLW